MGSTEVYIPATRYENTKAYQWQYLKFSFNMKKKKKQTQKEQQKTNPTYFYASLVLNLTESLELKYSKNTQTEENSCPENFHLKC